MHKVTSVQATDKVWSSPLTIIYTSSSATAVNALFVFSLLHLYWCNNQGVKFACACVSACGLNTKMLMVSSITPPWSWWHDLRRNTNGGAATCPIHVIHVLCDERVVCWQHKSSISVGDDILRQEWQRDCLATNAVATLSTDSCWAGSRLLRIVHLPNYVQWYAVVIRQMAVAWELTKDKQSHTPNNIALLPT